MPPMMEVKLPSATSQRAAELRPNSQAASTGYIAGAGKTAARIQRKRRGASIGGVAGTRRQHPQEGITARQFRRCM